MVASIGAVASPAQGVSYYEKDSYYAKDSDEHRAASAWAGKGAAELGLKGPVDPDTFREEDGWRARMEEEYLRIHRWFRDHNVRVPDAGWRSQYVEDVVALGYTSRLGD